MNQIKIPIAEYKAYAKEFNPFKYNPETWAKLLDEAGIKCLVIKSFFGWFVVTYIALVLTMLSHF